MEWFLLSQEQEVDRIKQVAMEFDNAIESKDIDLMVSFFADDCKIELMGIALL